MIEALVETWRINCRVTDYLFAELDEPKLACALSKGKTVRGQFTHIHNVRRMWVQAAAPELATGIEKLDDKKATAAEIEAALSLSCEAVAALISSAGEPGGRIKGFKPHAAAFVGYLCAHESYHRGHAELALRQAGMPIDDRVAYGQWEWGVR